jgi:hypothetical protein
MKKKIASKQAPAKATAKPKAPKKAIRHKPCGGLTAPPATQLFDRVATILDAARSCVVRAVNSRMVLAYWLIGREIVQEFQGGDERAEYGKRVISDLCAKLTQRYGSGYSAANLWLFRQFYHVFQERQSAILKPLGRESGFDPEQILDPLGRETETSGKAPFHPQLSWSHYRAIMRVEKPHAREFYENECGVAGWTKRELERQIHSLYYERLKCFVLIDLKMGKLTHQDIGQMDGYVRMYEDIYKVAGDNPTIGLCFCGNHNALDFANDASLFDGKTELSLVA